MVFPIPPDRRTLTPMAVFARLWRIFPGTILLVATFLVVGTLFATVLRDDPPRVREYVGWYVATLKAGRYWRQLPGTLLQGAPGFKRHQPLLIALFVGWLEYEIRGWRAVATFFLCDWISAPIATAVVWACFSVGIKAASGLY